jgi:cytochrome c-type biogenesis protein CcmH/NrfG
MSEIRNLSRLVREKNEEHKRSLTQSKDDEYKNLLSKAKKNHIERTEAQKNSLNQNYIMRVLGNLNPEYCFLALIAIAVSIEMIYLFNAGELNLFRFGNNNLSPITKNSEVNAIQESANRFIAGLKSNQNEFRYANTDNPLKLKFLGETKNLEIYNIAFDKNEKCYYANALADAEKNISFKFTWDSGNYIVAGIDVED